MPYLPVEYDGVYDAECQFDDDPEVVAAGVVGGGHLYECLDDARCLEVCCDDIVFLVCAEEGLLVVGKVADE